MSVDLRTYWLTSQLAHKRQHPEPDILQVLICFC